MSDNGANIFGDMLKTGIILIVSAAIIAVVAFNLIKHLYFEL
jgi:hypothetical protein